MQLETTSKSPEATRSIRMYSNIWILCVLCKTCKFKCWDVLRTPGTLCGRFGLPLSDPACTIAVSTAPSVRSKISSTNLGEMNFGWLWHTNIKRSCAVLTFQLELASLSCAYTIFNHIIERWGSQRDSAFLQAYTCFAPSWLFPGLVQWQRKCIAEWPNVAKKVQKTNIPHSNHEPECRTIAEHTLINVIRRTIWNHQTGYDKMELVRASSSGLHNWECTAICYEIHKHVFCSANPRTSLRHCSTTLFSNSSLSLCNTRQHHPSTKHSSITSLQHVYYSTLLYNMSLQNSSL